MEPDGGLMRLAIASVVMILSSWGSIALAQQDWRALYLEHQRALAACDDVKCFRAYIRQYGSKSNIAAFERAPDAVLNAIFGRQRDLARREVAHPDAITIDVQRAEADRMILIIKSRSDLGLDPK